MIEVFLLWLSLKVTEGLKIWWGKQCNQGMTYLIKFTILHKDCLVMKKISNWPITAADTDFSNL